MPCLRVIGVNFHICWKRACVKDLTNIMSGTDVLQVMTMKYRVYGHRSHHYVKSSELKGISKVVCLNFG